jgi:hypothetical protein
MTMETFNDGEWDFATLFVEAEMELIDSGE